VPKRTLPTFGKIVPLGCSRHVVLRGEVVEATRMSAQQGATIHIRRAKPGDCQAIASVLHESFQEYERLYTRDAFVATTPGPEQVLERMNEGPVWVALAEGRVVATASIVAKADGIYIRGMAVLPDATGGAGGAGVMKDPG
jgi:N-acetylglutamate synthase-like GNAT family acetyltransferase